MADETVSGQIGSALYDAILNRMNITWEPDAKLAQNILNAIEEAQSYLRSIAGNPELSFDSGEKRGLLIDCTQYFVEKKRAEFTQEYSGELIALRLEEGFGCGKESESTV